MERDIGKHARNASPPTSRRTGREYRADIDGLRAIAVLSVFLFHLDASLVPGGFLGVDIFFVISGYLITGIILRENMRGEFSFSHFYARRIKRIFPALFVLLLLTACVAILLLTPDTYVNFMKSARYASAQVANFFFARDVGYFDEGFFGQPLLHTWSLGVEEQFYLFWPLLIFVSFRFFQKWNSAAGRIKPEWSGLVTAARGSGMSVITGQVAAVFIVLSLISFGLCFYLAEANHKLAFYMFYTRAWEFSLGGFLALGILPQAETKRLANLIGLAGVVLLGYSLLYVEEIYLGLSFLKFGVVLACLGSAMILYGNQRYSLFNQILATPVPVFVGRISYSLYLYHWPVIIFYKLYFDRHIISFSAAMVIVVVSLFLSIASYRLVEQPFRKSTLSDRRVILYALLVIIGFSATFKYLERYDAAAWRITSYANQTTLTDVVDLSGCKGRTLNGLRMIECSLSGRADAPVVALVGDSHVPHFHQSTVSWARKHGFDVISLTVPGCPMLLGEVQIKSTLDPNHELRCSKALPLLASHIVENPRVKLILMAQRFDLLYDGRGYQDLAGQYVFKDQDGNRILEHTAYYRGQMAYTVEKIRQAGQRLVILKQVPLLGNIMACDWEPLLKKIFSVPRECRYDQSYIELRLQPSIDFVDQFAAAEQVPVFDPVPYFDAPLQNGVNIYKDIDHLNQYGFQFLVPHFTEAMDQILLDYPLEEEPHQAPD